MVCDAERWTSRRRSTNIIDLVDEHKGFFASIIAKRLRG